MCVCVCVCVCERERERETERETERERERLRERERKLKTNLEFILSSTISYVHYIIRHTKLNATTGLVQGNQFQHGT